MTFKIDVTGNISPSLARVIDAEIKDRVGRNPPTLRVVLKAMNEGLVDRLIREGTIDADERENLFSEINALIEGYGGETLAQSFMKYRASENLAIVIQAEIDNPDAIQPVTLGSVLEAMRQGLVATLVGRGDIDPDEDETLVAEIEQLIKMNGPNALAEEFLP